MHNSSVERGSDGIIRIREAGYQTRESILEVSANAAKIADEVRKKGGCVKVLVEMCASAGRSSEAYAEGPSFLKLNCDAMAVCGTTTITRLIANWYIKKSNQQHRMRYFQTSERALRWLRQKS